MLFFPLRGTIVSLVCVYKYGKDVLYTPSASPDYPSNNLFCKRALRCAISMTGRWSLSRGFSSPVYLAFLAPSCVSLSLSHFRFLARLMCTNLSNRLQLDLSLQTEETTRTVTSLSGRNRYPSNFFLFFSLFFRVGDWSRTHTRAFACFFPWLIVRSLSCRQTRVKDARVLR